MSTSGASPEFPGDTDSGRTGPASGDGRAETQFQEAVDPGTGNGEPWPGTLAHSPPAEQPANPIAVSSLNLVWPPEDFFTLDSRRIKADRIAGLIIVALLFLGAVIVIGIQVFASGWDIASTVLTTSALAILVPILVLTWKWPTWEFARTRWRINPSGLEIHKGVWWRHRIVVPLSRVQHADVTQGPLQRSYGIGTLVVHTAGTSHSSVELQGIDHEGAVQLRDTIVRFRSNQDGQ